MTKDIKAAGKISGQVDKVCDQVTSLKQGRKKFATVFPPYPGEVGVSGYDALKISWDFD